MLRGIDALMRTAVSITTTARRGTQIHIPASGDIRSHQVISEGAGVQFFNWRRTFELCSQHEQDVKFGGSMMECLHNNEITFS